MGRRDKDFETFEAYMKSGDGYQTSNVWSRSQRVKDAGEDKWSFNGEIFETPGNTQNEVLAAWYITYVLACRKRGLVPGPFTSLVDDAEPTPVEHTRER